MKLVTVPNLICLLRIALTVPIVILLAEGRYGQTLALFAIAAVSDMLDGYLAKTFGWTSAVGKWLDPLADKLLLVSVFITLAAVVMSAFHLYTAYAIVPTQTLRPVHVAFMSESKWSRNEGNSDNQKAFHIIHFE